MPTKVKTSGVDNTPVLSEQSWQQQLSASISSIAALCAYLEVALEELPASVAALHDFPLRVPLSFAKQIEKGNPNDPLLRQILPVSEELLNVAEYTDDPVGDLSAAKVTGVIHKYHGRVLLINTGTCAIHCRYCFRRHFPYSDLQLSKQLLKVSNQENSPEFLEEYDFESLQKYFDTIKTKLIQTTIN